LIEGKVIKDINSGDLGVLTRRFNVMTGWEDEIEVWVWEILWAGPETDSKNRYTPSTETAIVALLNSGSWTLLES
jgi:hypothetical protein